MFSPIVSRAALVLALATAAPVTAQEQLIPAQNLINEVGGAERIDRAGYLRTLTQRIPAAACNDASGISRVQAEQVLAQDMADFDAIMNALAHGDDALGIFGPEEDRRVLEGLSAIAALWSEEHSEIEAMLGGDLSISHAQKLAELSGPMLEAAKANVNNIRDEYADPTALVAADAIVIDVAGRQRMLPQMISKNVCLVSAGIMVEASKEQLAATVETYEVSLQALRFGMAAAGISSPPSQEVRDGLDEVAADWEALKPIVTAVLEGQAVSDTDREKVFLGANSLTAKMNTVVGMYAEASKLGL